MVVLTRVPARQVTCQVTRQFTRGTGCDVLVEQGAEGGCEGPSQALGCWMPDSKAKVRMEKGAPPCPLPPSPMVGGDQNCDSEMCHACPSSHHWHTGVTGDTGSSTVTVSKVSLVWSPGDCLMLCIAFTVLLCTILSLIKVF